MDLAWLFPFFLFLHVLGAIVAFGPTFAFSIIGAMGGKEPQHANFATRVSATISRPDGLSRSGSSRVITGVLLIWISGSRPVRAGVAAGRDRAVRRSRSRTR